MGLMVGRQEVRLQIPGPRQPGQELPGQQEQPKEGGRQQAAGSEECPFLEQAGVGGLDL